MDFRNDFRSLNWYATMRTTKQELTSYRINRYIKPSPHPATNTPIQLATMASNPNPTSSGSSRTSWIVHLYVSLATNPVYDTVFLVLLLLAEFVLGGAIIRYVPYTEIDWKAYMQEVEIWWLDGEYDYRNIYGGTGPLVYPAGFLYLFGILRWMTDSGKNVLRAQYFFLAFYLAIQATVLLLVQQCVRSVRTSRRLSGSDGSGADGDLSMAHQIWSWRIAMGSLCLSKRIHSIFMLRLFNDGITMLLLYVSILLITRNRWNIGCFVFSLAISIKMNVLLFAPGLLLLLLQVGPDLKTVFYRLMLCCALPQLVLGAPFLLTFPVSYLRKAFELDRVFFYKWTVNFKVRVCVFSLEPLQILVLLMLMLMLMVLQSNSYEIAQLNSTHVVAHIVVVYHTTVPARRNVLVERIGTYTIDLAFVRFGLLRRPMVASDQGADRTTHIPEQTLVESLYYLHHADIQLYWHLLRPHVALSVLRVVLSRTTLLTVDQQ
jgi:hypothetical protein